MSNVVIVGAQWGDEGKGKVVDLYTEHADVVVRFGGGANAGHTLVVNGEKLVTHLIPSGVLRKGVRCVLGDGMVVHPGVLLEEMADLKARGLLQDDKDLLIGEKAHVILPIHTLIDGLREQQKGALGTTKRGIGPAYESKVGRRGIRMGDLLRPERLPALVERTLDEAAPLIRHLGGTPPTAAEILADLEDKAARLGRYIGDAARYVYGEIRKGRSVLFEGAQGALLDIDHGTYPFVTSSSTTAGGACSGTGIGPTEIDSVIGIAKAYTTRVGAGPVPTELEGDAGARLREAGAEFGATTGRPRRCGWLDVAALRVAVRLNGMTGLAITKLDVLGGMGPLKVCVGYQVTDAGGRVEDRDELPLDPGDIVAARPIYEDVAGWDAVTREVREVADLPVAARKYVSRIEALTGVEVVLLSVGPGRAETMVIKHPFR
ncbi:MAG: adenylosuccinate synthase [Deltaproteobacteria bacterium]|nr:adenylosuccinate synthase [Deltaproteobacteria bacterium]